MERIDRRVLDRWAKWSIEGCRWRWINRLGEGKHEGWRIYVNRSGERERESFLISCYETFKDSYGITSGAQRNKSYRKNTEFLWVSKKSCFPSFSSHRVPFYSPLILWYPKEQTFYFFFFLEYSLSEISSSFFSRKTYNNSNNFTLSVYLRNHSDYIEESSLFSLLMKNKSFQINEDTPRNWSSSAD